MNMCLTDSNLPYLIKNNAKSFLDIFMIKNIKYLKLSRKTKIRRIKSFRKNPIVFMLHSIISLMYIAL